MSIHVRDLIEHLSVLPPEMRLRLVVVTLAGTKAAADDYQIRLNEDVAELQVSGALVRLVADDPVPEDAR